MTVRGGYVALAVGVGLIATSAARGQALPNSAKVDTAPLQLTNPDRFQVPAVLEPVRQVNLIASAEGVVRSQEAKVGATVREGQEVAQLDRSEAAARLKIAQAEVKEAEAAVEVATGTVTASGETATTVVKAGVAQAQARLDAARARGELAQIAFDRCALRAPFAGRVLASPVSDGQYVPKGAVITELADVSSLKVLVPVRRAGATVGGAVTLNIEGQNVAGKIQALLPLPESLAVIRELASPYTAAWVVLPNTSGSLEPGQRALSPDLPLAPIATIPAHALKTDDKTKGQSRTPEAGSSSTVQVIRNEYVTDVKVGVIGRRGPDRVEVTGPLRPTDALIVSSSVPLLAGTLIRFNHGTAGDGGVEGTNPNPAESGAPANLTPPRDSGRTGPAPIGAPGSAAPKGKRATSRPGTQTPAAPKSGANPVPF